MRILIRSMSMMAIATALYACASSPDNIEATNVSTDTYAYMTCTQLADYGAALTKTYTEAADQENDARAEDVVGYALLQQPLGSQRHQQIPAEIADLKGRLVAVHALQSSKNCHGRSASVDTTQTAAAGQ
jgi:hypothetical protein